MPADIKARSWLNRVERWGNALPDPVFIFLGLIAVLICVSVAGSILQWHAINPLTGDTVVTQSLLSADNVRKLLTDMPDTMAHFPPLGLILVVMLGAAVAERSGLFTALMTRAMRDIPTRFLSPAIFLIGLFSHHAADAAYVVLIPLAAIIFASAGRHPLAGMAIAYAGISGAFAANLVPGQFDVLMMGITKSATSLLTPDHNLNPLGNWWFTAALGIILVPIAWIVNDSIVEPRLGKWTGNAPGNDIEQIHDPIRERRGLIYAGLFTLILVGIFAFLAAMPGYAPLIDDTAQGPSRLQPFYSALVAGFMLLFLGSGWIYGSVVGTVKSHRDVVRMMGEGLATLSPFLVIAFFAAHFIAMFGWSNLGPVLAINGAEWLRTLQLSTPLLLIILLVMSSVFDLFIGSASAKWTAMAPIVVPMLMLLGISPEMTTAAYRMGDSIFNIVTPVASNFVLVMVLAQRWDKTFGVGSLIALMLPFSIAIGLVGLCLVGIWTGFELPVGPSAPSTYQLTPR
ncbi:AbgT family transporter [Sphingorhabdus sp.]|uniref:AbgT family transporter n=1 Tax=Sphingorhabdus sp. TaxID=1902408 RepID=UPI00391909EE